MENTGEEEADYSQSQHHDRSSEAEDCRKKLQAAFELVQPQQPTIPIETIDRVENGTAHHHQQTTAQQQLNKPEDTEINRHQSKTN